MGRLGVRGGSAPGTVNTAIKNPEGFTVHVVSGKVPTAGYAVAGLGREKQINIGERPATVQDIKLFVHQNKDLLSKPEYYLGGWTEGGKLYLDVTQPIGGTKSYALTLAHARNEIAIYGFKEQQSFYTMKDHQRPDGRKRDNPLGESNANAPDDEKRTYFIFGKDMSFQAIADAINKQMGRDTKKG
jgi:hypothetical protein